MGHGFRRKASEAIFRDWLIGKGEMADAIRSFDWSKTDLGPRDQWPTALRFTVNAMLATKLPTVIIWSEQHLLLYNDGNSKVAGNRQPNLLGRSGPKAWPEFWQLVDPVLKRVLQHETVFLEDQLIPIRCDQNHLEEAWFTASYSPISLEEGQVGGILVTFIETTERKRAEEKREQYFKFFNASTDLMVIADPNGAFKEVNPTCMEVLGYSEAELLTKPFVDFVHPDDRQSTLDEMARQIKLGFSINFENRYICKDGSVRSLFWRGYFNPMEGLTYATARDITEYKRVEATMRQSEERFKAIFDYAPVLIDAFDDKGHCVLWNNECQKLFGWTLEEINACDNPLALFYPDPVVRSQVIATITTQPEGVFREWHPRTKIGTELVCMWANLKLPDGLVMNIGYDISLRKRLEKDLRAAIEIRDEFMSIASHELKTPLTALSMQIELLNQIISMEEGAINHKIAVLSKKAQKAVMSLTSLLNDLLDVTRIRVGKLTLEKQKMDLQSATLKMVSSLQEEAKRKGISITLKKVQPVLGEWDPIRIDQILSNLLSNAIKYGEGKAIEVTVTADYDSNLACIMVKDYGMGIEHEMQTKIFERFQRAVSGGTISGLGLGLYITRQIVEAHGGTIRVESEPYKGSLFIVELPIRTQITK